MTKVDNLLESMHERGFAIIRVHQKSKQPIEAGWQRHLPRSNDLASFLPGENVGVVLGDASGGIVDIDLDSEIARAIGPELLPPTDAIFGRCSAPRSHWIYRVVEPGPSFSLSVGKPRVVEYRSNGSMTVFPPSVHPSGEPIRWHTNSEIGHSTRRELEMAMRTIAAVEALAPFYVEGSRHALALEAGGAFAAWGLDEEFAERTLYGLAKWHSDPEVGDRMLAVSTSYERRRAGEPCTGEHHLAARIGKRSVERLKKLCGISRVAPLEPSRSAEVADLSDLNRNDAGVAALFSKWAKGRTCYVGGTNAFFAYGNGLWKADTKEVFTIEIFAQFIEERRRQLRGSTAPNAVIDFDSKFLAKYQNTSHIANALKQVRAHLHVPIEKFDRGDDILAVRNGVVDLRTGECRPTRAEDYLTRRCDVDYDPAAKCPTFMKFLRTTFSNDDELITYVQMILGYCLTGRTDMQSFFIFHGYGSNGKSTLTNIIEKVLGSYCGILMPETIFDGGNVGNVDLATLAGRRLALASEAESRHRLDSGRLKRLTGDSTIKVKPLYRDSYEMPVKFKIIISCNEPPELDGNDLALKRRIVVIPFKTVIHERDRDPNLSDKLAQEKEGILRWLIEGARLYFKGCIIKPPAVLQATDEYHNEYDVVSAFLKSWTKRDQSATISKTALYDGFFEYCSNEGAEPYNIGKFGKAIKMRGYQSGRNSSERFWRGLRLLSDAERKPVMNGSSLEDLFRQ